MKISTYLTGTETSSKRATVKVTVAVPEVKRALWAYGTGYKRTETGYKEQTYGFVEIIGLENQTLPVKVWVKGKDANFYNEPDTYLLDKKEVKLDDKGKGSFMITTNDTYKQIIDKALPATTDNPNPKQSLVFTIEVPAATESMALPADMKITNTEPVVGTKFYKVLDTNEELTLTNEQKIKSIVFATEDGKDVQLQITHYGKKHKIRVHTVNMVDEELKIDVLKEVPKEGMTTTDDITYTHESKNPYPAEKVGADSVVELDFTLDKDWAKPPQNIDYYIAQVSQKVKDANDPKKESYVLLKSQVILNNAMGASLEHDAEMEKMGIKAKKADGTPFTPDEMVALRKQYILYEQGALKVSQLTATPEAIDNSDVLVTVEMAEVERTNTECVCKKNNFYWSSQITCEERKKVLEVCASLWGEDKKVEKASELMAIFHLETGTKDSFKPYADNGVGYSGLIQFSDATAASVGTTRAALKKMTFIEQMDYVKKYLEKNRNKLTTLTDFYLQVIKPNAVGNGGNPDYILFDESISVPDGDGSGTSHEQRIKNITREPWVTKYGYSSNGTFMLEEGESTKREKWVYTKQKKEMRPGFHNGKTTVGEVTQVVTKNHYDPGKALQFNGSCKNATSVNLTGKAPWIQFAFSEFETYKGLIEKESPLKEKISEYFNTSSAPGLKYTDPWCGAFIVWCFEQTTDFKKINKLESARAFGWLSSRWDKGEDCEAFVGATIIFDYSHVAFIVGESNDGTGYIYLGGNQGNGDKRAGHQKICMGFVRKSDGSIKGITKPKDYVVADSEKVFPKYDITTENTRDSSR